MSALKQAVFRILFVQLLVVMAFFSTSAVFLLLHLTATLFYLGCIALRALASMSFDKNTRSPPLESEFDRSFDNTLPAHSILVPLYGEQGQVGDLVAALA